MEAIWFAIISAMLAVYAVLDGFDFGVGILHRFVARTDEERRTVLAAIGPIWDGNEVWLIAAGGVLFVAFPRVYATAFSGFYLALIIVLWLLILRGVAIEFRCTGTPLWPSSGTRSSWSRRRCWRWSSARRSATSSAAYPSGRTVCGACRFSRTSSPAVSQAFSTGTRGSSASSRSSPWRSTAPCTSCGGRRGPCGAQPGLC